MVKSKASRASLAKAAKSSAPKPAKTPPPRLTKDEAPVFDASLGYDATRTCVATLRAEHGEEPKSRMTAPRVTKLFVGFREKIEDPALLERVGAFGKELEAPEKKALRDELPAVKAAIAAIESELR